MQPTTWVDLTGFSKVIRSISLSKPQANGHRFIAFIAFDTVLKYYTETDSIVVLMLNRDPAREVSGLALINIKSTKIYFNTTRIWSVTLIFGLKHF